MPVAQSFNKILLTTSNNAENNILLQEISGALCVNNAQVIVSDHAAPSLQIESNDALSQTTYSEDSIILEGVSGRLYSNGTDLQSPTFTGLSDTPNSFVSGKYLRVNDAGDALEYVDITSVSSGGTSYTFSASSYQENILKDHISADNDTNFNDLHFTGLETGAYYRLGGQVRFVGGYGNAGINMWFYAYQDNFTTDNIVAALNSRPGGEADPVNATHTFNHIFQATGDLFFTGNGLDSSQDRYIYGDGSKTQTYVQLEKLTVEGGGSAGQYGINSLALTNSHPSTDSIEIAIPDAIIATSTANNDFILSLEALTNNSTDLANNRNLIYNSYGTQFNIEFSNDASGSFYQSSNIISDHQQNLKWFIDNGRALYYGSADIGSATPYIESVVTKTEAGPIDKRSTDTTESTTNYYRVPVESLRFDDLEVGATYRINVSLLGYHGSNDLGCNLTIHNRANSFSSDINLDGAGINNYSNNGGDPDPSIIVIASAGNDTTLYGETHSQTKIFEATGTHLDVLANSISSNSFLGNITIQLEKITVGTSGAYASNSKISDNLSFSYNFPDALLVPLSRGNGYQERIFPFVGVFNGSATSLSGVWSGGRISYELGLGSERFQITFNNDSSGTFNSYVEVGDASTTDVVWSEMSPATTNQPTLKEFIDANRAIYYK